MHSGPVAALCLRRVAVQRLWLYLAVILRHFFGRSGVWGTFQGRLAGRTRSGLNIRGLGGVYDFIKSCAVVMPWNWNFGADLAQGPR